MHAVWNIVKYTFIYCVSFISRAVISILGNRLLRQLHKSFLQIVEERNIPCLSFGETQKTPLGMKLKVTIVPPESSGKIFNLG